MEKVLTVIKGQEFKLSLKDKIEEKDIFYNQYLEAAAMLDDIVANNEKENLADWMKAETENNIIAFCGERGEGKSSAMFTFIKAVYDKEVYEGKGRKNVAIFEQCESVKNTIFSEPIVIDPSAFDNVHNVLDIIIASLYRKFYDKYDAFPEQFDKYKREQLLQEFQKVYKDISLLNDPVKMLEEEYDYEGSIEKISKMGESLRLRRDLSKLVKLYLDYMLKDETHTGYTSKKLLIAIDDLDMCNANAYKMAEQIRKYLIIPDIVIVMALKVEQLQLCVQEENFKNYSNVLKNQGKIAGTSIDVKDMAERYIAKLIPKSRRIYLPNVRYIENAKISYQKKNEEIIYEDKMTNSLNASLLDLIYMKTGMRFLLNEEKMNWLQPDNLRDTVNLIILLGDMKVPENDSEFLENIEKFTEYYEKEWIPQNCQLENYKEVQNSIRLPYLQLNSEVWYWLDKHYKKTDKKNELPSATFQMETGNCFFWILNWFNTYKNSMFDKKADKFVYMFEILYTIRLNKLQRSKSNEAFGKFIGGYIWGPSFDDMLPADENQSVRSRFAFSTISVYNIISRKIGNAFNINNELLDSNKDYISKLTENYKEKEYKIINWMLLGLFSNICVWVPANGENPPMPRYIYNTCIIFSNYRLNNTVQICLENYIVGICSLESLYKKLNIEILGVSKVEFQKVADKIENDNFNKIQAFRTIFSNIDLIMRFHEYCWKNRQSKEGGSKDERGKTRAVVDQFFRNIERFYREYINEDFREKLNNLVLRDSDGEEVVISISELYAELLQRSIEESISYEENQKQNKVKKMMDSLKFEILPNEPLQSVSTYLINKSSDNVMKNVRNMLHNMKCYQLKHEDEKIEEHADFIKTRNYLLDYYRRVAEYEVENPKLDITKELNEEYKNIAKLYSKYNEGK
ncbi:hypothetical protein [Blautia sp. MSJ-19]|uniref:hypothetical protein n=1 Tax=Blautia sp. MSJ-19 TaxID=2841517 RepID=UPI001C0ED59F|nr:hypothetical protein [Blautia sp. MSJ-19]MBU5481556.1 hypothetical protein [Blautia sp. MSJ-19]